MPKIRADSLAAHHDLMWAALLDALEGLLATRAWDRITLADVAAEVGMARSAIYNYVPDKAALLAASSERAARALVARVAAQARGPGPASARLAAMVRTLLEAFSAGPHQHLLLLSLSGDAPAPSRPRLGATYTALAAEFEAVVGAGVDAGVFRRTDDLALTVRLVAGVLQAAVRQVAQGAAPLERVRAQTEAFLLGALRAA